MKKIPNLFMRGRDGKLTKSINPECTWVIEGLGTPTVKLDGTSCYWDGHSLFRRYDAKCGRTPPADFLACQPAPDPHTGHWPGWVPVSDTDPSDKWHREALASETGQAVLLRGTYELVGPKVNGNPQNQEHHMLIRHGLYTLEDTARSTAALREQLRTLNAEGIVWHLGDGRMCKLRRKDFGFTWPLEGQKVR